MAVLDDDAARLLAVMASRGAVDITTMEPAAVRAHYDAFAGPRGREVHAVRDLTIPGPAGDIPARLYLPSDAPNLPVLVWYHGGGMVIGSLKGADWICRELCVLAGTAVVSVDYRLAPEAKFPAAVEDAYAAAAWVATHAAEFGGVSANVSVGGDSAGGTCAAVTCLLAKQRGGPVLKSQLLIYPGTDRDLNRPSVTEFANGPILTRAAMLWFRGHYHSNDAELSDMRANPALANDHTGLPQACVLTAEIDPIRDAGENYGRLLVQAGVLTTMKRYAGVYHGFFTMGPFMAKTAMAVADAACFLRQVPTTP
jgi:acetyl esterase